VGRGGASSCLLAFSAPPFLWGRAGGLALAFSGECRQATRTDCRKAIPKPTIWNAAGVWLEFQAARP